MNNGGRSRLLRALVALGLTTYVVWRSDPGLVLRAVASARWQWLLVAVALVLADRALMAHRWVTLLCALSGTRPPFRAILRIFFVSTFVGSFLPSVAGDVYRAYSLSRLHVSVAESAASVIMDRALGILSMVLVAIVAVLFAPRGLFLPGVLLTIGIAGAGCLLAAAAIYSERIALMTVSLVTMLPGESMKRIGTALVNAIRKYREHHKEVTVVLVASIGVQLVRVLQAMCLGASLELVAPAWSYFLFVPLIVIIMQLPVTVSGLGTSQLAFGVFFAQVGVPGAQAVALSLLFVALGLVGNLPGALLYATGPRPEPAS